MESDFSEDRIRSSYKNPGLTYDHIFQLLCFVAQPTKIVEFGILDGFSLNSFVKYSPCDCEILAFDIFEDFIGNHANLNELQTLFSGCPNVHIMKKDFYKCVDYFDDESIDILHIDIANTGDVYKFAVDHYLKKVKKDGYMILEGGSPERDNVEWMLKYNKPKITTYLDSIKDIHDHCIIHPHPSITIIRRN